MERLELRRKGSRILKDLFLSSAFILGFVYVLYLGWIGFPAIPLWLCFVSWPCIAILLFSMILAIRQRIRRIPDIVLSDAGIEYPASKVGLVSWQEITKVYLKSQRTRQGSIPSQWLCVEARDPVAVLARRGRIWGALAKYAGFLLAAFDFDPHIVLTLPAVHMPIPAEELLSLIERYRKAATT